MSAVKEIARVEEVIRRNKRDAYRSQRTADRCRARLLASFTDSQRARFLKMENAQMLAAGYVANVETFSAVQAELMGQLAGSVVHAKQIVQKLNATAELGRVDGRDATQGAGAELPDVVGEVVQGLPSRRIVFRPVKPVYSRDDLAQHGLGRAGVVDAGSDRDARHFLQQDNADLLEAGSADKEAGVHVGTPPLAKSAGNAKGSK
jgi:hypothetical protein